MTKLFPIIVALGLAVAFTAPAVAGTGELISPSSQQACAKYKMHSDAQQKKCCKDATTNGRCMM
jgi:hypothetical protein